MKSEKHLLPNGSKLQKPLRLWPGIVIMIIQWLIRFVLPVVAPSDTALIVAVFGGMAGGLLIVIWWLFFSRAPIFERLAAIIIAILALVVTFHNLDESIATANMGNMFLIFSIPVMSLAFVIWAVVSRNLKNVLRRVTMVLTIFLASGGWLLLKTEGMTSDLHFNFAWRWAAAPEDRFLARAGKEQMVPPDTTKSDNYWPGFRGSLRDGIVHNSKIATDWKTSPPLELWRRPIGPGCSSFTVNGALIYTQEQRGDNEVVSCFNLTTGKPVWRHSDKARFWDSHAGAGPRSTPTLTGGRVYTMGATGILNALDAITGSVIWSRNAADDTKAKNSGWGFTGSPLIVDSLVIVAASGTLAAYDLLTGNPRWYGPNRGKGYSSPHLFAFGGVPQVILLTDSGAVSLRPADGRLLWKYQWPLSDRILQPAMTEDGDLLINGDMNIGLRRISVIQNGEGWKVNDIWTTIGIKPSFNDFVVFKGYAYGFNGRSIGCIDLKNGKRMWQNGHYGGQIILLSDQSLLLVLSEKGELALVSATPDKFTELAHFQAIEGKTWNHPVLAGDVLLVRNSFEMAAFRLAGL
jgi:outer membrane protein assembly factor BamB